MGEVTYCPDLREGQSYRSCPNFRGVEYKDDADGMCLSARLGDGCVSLKGEGDDKNGGNGGIGDGKNGNGNIGGGGGLGGGVKTGEK